MCIKSVYYNTYSDGQYDTTERVESCTPGYICPNPRTYRFDREYRCPRDQAKASQIRGDRLPGSSPRSLSPSPPLSPASQSSASPATSDASSGADQQREASSRRSRRRTSDVYINGTKVSTTSSSTPATSASTSASSPRTMPIPIKRAATMTYGGMEPAPERGRRPIIVEERVPSAAGPPPRMMPSAYAYPHPEILHHTTARPRNPLRDFREFRDLREVRDARADHFRDVRPAAHHPAAVGIERTSSLRRRSDRESMPPPPPPPSDNFLSPSRARTERSPQGYGSAEDEKERAERRRRRRVARERASVMPSSLPAMGNTDVFGSSYEAPSSSSAATSAATSAANSASASPAVSAVKKELRWEDEMRRLQNERIQSRPKLSRSQAVPPNTKLQGEVKSILKNTTTTSTPAGSGAATPAGGRPEGRPTETGASRSRASSRASSSRPPSSSSRRASFAGPPPDFDIFTTGLSGLNISTPPPPPPAQGEPPLDDDAERAYQSRLRNRFSMPPRRYTAGGPFKRRTEIWYPEEGRYRFM